MISLYRTVTVTSEMTDLRIVRPDRRSLPEHQSSRRSAAFVPHAPRCRRPVRPHLNLFAEEMAHRVQRLYVVADDLDDHHHRHGEQHAPDTPDPTPEQ
jgi:hypothetical protein